MKTDTIPRFPENLIRHLGCSDKAIFISGDRLAGIEYAVSTLPEDKQRWVTLRFREGLSAEDAARILDLTPEEEKALERDTAQKLRGTSRWDWILFGIEGNTRRIKIRIRAEAYEDGYRKGLEDGRSGIVPPTPDAATLALPISALPLSNRVLACLDRKDCTNVGSLLCKDEYDIIRIRGLGARGRSEVILALRQIGISGTAWERCSRL